MWLSRVRFALRPQKRDDLLGTGGRGRKSEGSTADTARKRPERPWTAARTMEVLIKAVSPRHCPSTCALRNCCFNCRAWAESQGQCPLHCCWGTTRSERSPTFAAQLRLPVHDLFWANLKVQLHLPPLDLLIFWSHLEPWVAFAVDRTFKYRVNKKSWIWLSLMLAVDFFHTSEPRAML